MRELSDSETMQIALIENLQRKDLNALEEAKGYKTLIDEYGFSQEEVARTVGKSRPAVANTLRLLGLPDDVKDMLEDGRLSAGHARALLSIENKDNVTQTAKQVVKDGLSVRETEKLAKKAASENVAKKPKKKSTVPTLYREAELSLSEHLGTKVSVVENKKKGGGTLCIEFYDPSELFTLTKKIEELWNK